MLLFTAITILPISSPVFAQEEEEEMLQPHPNPIDGDTASNNAPPVPDGDPLAEKGRIDKVLLGESLGLGVQPALGARKGIGVPGQNAGMEIGDDEPDERPAESMGKLKPGAPTAMGIIVDNNRVPAGIQPADKGIINQEK